MWNENREKTTERISFSTLTESWFQGMIIVLFLKDNVPNNARNGYCSIHKDNVPNKIIEQHRERPLSLFRSDVHMD